MNEHRKQTDTKDMERARCPPFAAVHAGWWLCIVSGMLSLALVSIAPEAAPQPLVHLALLVCRSQAGAQAVLACACAAHIFEALLVMRIVRPGRAGDRALWMLQTAVLGYPSLRMLRGAIKRA